MTVGGSLSAYTEYTYSSGQRTRADNYNASDVLQSYSLYSYDGGGSDILWDRIDNYDSSDNHTGYDLLYYNENDMVVKTEHYDASNNLESYAQYTYESY